LAEGGRVRHFSRFISAHGDPRRAEGNRCVGLEASVQPWAPQRTAELIPSPLRFLAPTTLRRLTCSGFARWRGQVAEFRNLPANAQ